MPGLDAVLIATETSMHASLAIKAIEAGLVNVPLASMKPPQADEISLQHVLLEKPISVDVETTKPVIEAATARPNLKVMIGFSRRC
jgi:myo-inositol 2-dehydrogenase / D-chiro-inositol 1-dehydrogenase